MNSHKAAYWIALGVMALGLNSEYQSGNFAPLHRLSDRADSLYCRLAARVEQTVMLARVLTGSAGLPADTLMASADAADLAREQAELVREQALIQSELLRDKVRYEILDQADAWRTQAGSRRNEIRQIRASARSQLRLARTPSRQVMVVCPKGKTRVAVDAGNSTDSARIEMRENF